VAVSRAVRRLVLARAAGRCEYCRILGWPLTVDHVTPTAVWSEPIAPALAGLDPDSPDNLAAACALCNRGKSSATTGYDSVTEMEHPLFHPRRDRWEDHFAWADHYLKIVALTPTGRATLAQLDLDRSEYRAQRALLRAAMRGGGPPWP
jgi:5-methylcytosine-specific restriction endonuclease McrA